MTVRPFSGKVGITLFLLLIAAGLVLASCIPRSDEVINTSFALAPGTRYGGESVVNGLSYHTRVLVRSTLRGEVTVKGEGVYLIIRHAGSDDTHYVEEGYVFRIDPPMTATHSHSITRKAQPKAW